MGWTMPDSIRQHLLHSEFSRFVVVGGINTVFGYSLYFALNFYLHYQLAYALAYVAGVYFSYWMNVRWVFREQISWKSLLAFPLVYVVQYLMNAGLLHVLIEYLGLSEWLAPVIVIFLGVPVTFLLSRFIIRSGSAARQ